MEEIMQTTNQVMDKELCKDSKKYCNLTKSDFDRLLIILIRKFPLYSWYNKNEHYYLIAKKMFFHCAETLDTRKEFRERCIKFELMETNPNNLLAKFAAINVKREVPKQLCENNNEELTDEQRQDVINTINDWRAGLKRESRKEEI
jgi:hypothetical protein